MLTLLLSPIKLFEIVTTSQAYFLGPTTSALVAFCKGAIRVTQADIPWHLIHFRYIGSLQLGLCAWVLRCVKWLR